MSSTPGRFFPSSPATHAPDLSGGLSQFPIDGNEHGTVFGVNIHDTDTVTVVVHVRLISAADQRIKAIEHRLPLAPGDALERFFTLERGALQSVIVYTESTNPVALGEVFTSMRLVRGSQSTFIYGATLVQGYVTPRSSLAWPGSPIQDLHSGRGVVRLYALANASVAAVALIPANRRARIITGSAVLTTSAAGVARRPYLEIQRDGSIVWQHASVDTQAISTVRRYNLTPGFIDYAAPGSDLRVLSMAPDVELRGGDQVAIGATGAELTDAWTGGSLLVREWYEPQ